MAVPGGLVARAMPLKWRGQVMFCSLQNVDQATSSPKMGASIQDFFNKFLLITHACTKDKVSCSPEKFSSGTFAAGEKF